LISAHSQKTYLVSDIIILLLSSKLNFEQVELLFSMLIFAFLLNVILFIFILWKKKQPELIAGVANN